MSANDAAKGLEPTLREHFGLEHFRPGQREVITQVLARRDVLCVMPTGGGKSLCFQLPALLLEGVTLVVSPLIALMKDQVDALTERGLRATFLNSTLDPDEMRARLVEIEAGRYDLVYVAPERFRSGRFVEIMARARLALLAVDEAHCISEWGHDFRPDYARLGQARRKLGMPPCIALTATATDLVRRDIADQLDLHEPAEFVTGFDRPNLSYTVIEARRDTAKQDALSEVLERNPGAAIVYASSRKRCEEVGGFLTRDLRRDAVIYHAGLSREERTEAQDRFMTGRAEIVVATNAFGMGVDKPDIRSVVHFNMPGTLEAYYQEAGRAGRDGNPSECVLLYAPGDRFLQEMFIENEYPPPDMVGRLYDYLRTLDDDPIERTHAELAEAARLEIQDSAVGTALRILETAGGLERFHPRENLAIVRINIEPDEVRLSDRLPSQAHVQKLVMIALEGLVDRRFGEPVYFQPDELARATGIDRSALQRALKNLTSELPVDYIPPFRGNAIRLKDRNVRARDLRIDFASLNQRKHQEYDKLERMIRYAQTSQCRRAYILRYFGDTTAEECGQCDNCASDRGPALSQAIPIDTPAGREVLQKVLSGVARTKGRLGKSLVAQMLVGSSSERMTRLGLNRLSTFGILAHVGFTKNEVVEVIDALSAIGMIESRDVDRFRPVIGLTETGWTWLRDKEAPTVALPLKSYLAEKLRNGGLERLAPRSQPTSNGESESLTPEYKTEDEPPADEALFERLRELRRSWAREAGLSPGYIFSNETLTLICRLKPTSPRELAEIKGVGPAKLERYGTAILEAIAGSPVLSEEKEDELPEPTHEDAPRRPVDPDNFPPPGSAYWTARLIEGGFKLDEAVAIRRLPRPVIIEHLLDAVRNGFPLAEDAYLSVDVLTRWRSWRARHGDQPPAGEDAALLDLWPLFLACSNTSASRT